MAVFYAPETAMAKELRKWEYGNPEDGYRGYRENVTTEYPMWLHRAGVTDDGVIDITDRVLVNSPSERSKAEGNGFHFSQAKAIEHVHQQQQEIAKLAAERHYHERYMSPAAQREVEAYEAATDEHLATIPETPIKRGPGRPRKEAPDGVSK